jgi:hypothetical protein
VRRQQATGQRGAGVVIGGKVLDRTAIQDLAEAKSVYAVALGRVCVEHGITLAVPSTALMDTAASVAPANRPFLDLLLDMPVTVVVNLDQPTAIAAGVAAHDAHLTREYDAADAHTVYVAASRDWPVVTADPAPLLAINPTVGVEQLP